MSEDNINNKQGIKIAIIVAICMVVAFIYGRLSEEDQMSVVLETTPTPTLTPITPTATLTLTPLSPTATLTLTLLPFDVLAALERAHAFRVLENPTNRDWQPFVHEFEDGVPMVLVPTGCFDMVSEDFSNRILIDKQCFDTPFWIDQTEVTQAQFADLGGYQADPSDFAGQNRPVENVNWFEARDFCMNSLNLFVRQ
ncbi:MAG: SUMF1/EgtB/PvdO family nonheme iron enzyme [Anaerolineae bacterium]|nr:SUMF1/EgtB/PvdO family nonheme iron enzyme [Anaerolineae bacterium]